MRSSLQRQIIFLTMLFSTPADALESEFYGSHRLIGEYVESDNKADNFNTYSGLRDAYSRVGFKLDHELIENWSVLFHIELPLDLPNLTIQDPWARYQSMLILEKIEVVT